LFSGCASAQILSPEQVDQQIQKTEVVIEAKEILIEGVDQELDKLTIIRTTLEDAEKNDPELVKQRIRLAEAIRTELKQLKKWLTSTSAEEKNKLQEYKKFSTQTQ